MPAGVLILDTESPGWPVLSASDGCSDLTGHPVAELVGRCWPHFWDDGQPDLAPLAAAIAGAASLGPTRLSSLRRDGTRFDSEVQLLLCQGIAVLVLIDRAATQAAQVAYQDPLTGLRNRAGLHRDLTAA